MDVALVALGAFFTTLFAREAFFGTMGFEIRGWLSLAIALVSAGGIAYYIGADEAVFLAGAGGSTLIHKVHRWLSAHGDAQQAATISMALRRR